MDLLEGLSAIFIDHIVSNETQQNSFAVLSILEALLSFLKATQPAVKEINIVTDNATCYQNKIFPVAAGFISNLQQLTLRKVLHVETQSGKRLADAHFVVAF